MIDVNTALQNILKAIYGKDVRQSIHDAIYQINQNANEAVDLAQIKFGTAVTDPTSPISGYIEGTVYFNVGTGIIWRLSGGAWVRLGNMKAIDNIAKTATVGLTDTYTITYKDGTISTYNVENGISVTDITKSSTVGNVDHYDVNLSDGSTTPTGFDVRNGVDGVSIIGISKTGTTGNVDYYSVDLSDGTVTPTGFSVTNGKDGVSVKDAKLASTVGNTRNYNFELSDGTLTPTGFSISDGVSSYLHVRYSAQFDGTGMVSVPSATTKYIGICITNQSVAPTNPAVYDWVKFVGDSGTGTGDMLAADYATKFPNTVDRAAALFDGTTETSATQLMSKADYASKGVANTVDKAIELVDVTNSKIADTVLLANLSDDGTTGLKYKGSPIGGVVAIDNSTIKKNTSGELNVPIDNSTLYMSGGVMKAKQGAEVDEISIIKNASGKLEVSVDNDTIFTDASNKKIYAKPNFTTGDSTSLSGMTAPDTVAVISTNEAPKTRLNKITTMIKNLRWLLAKYGSADISSLGQGADIGTITGALVDLNAKIGQGGGGFFDCTLTVTCDDADLLGKTYELRQLSDDETVSPKAGRSGTIVSSEVFDVHCLGRYRFYEPLSGDEIGELKLSEFKLSDSVTLGLAKPLVPKLTSDSPTSTGKIYYSTANTLLPTWHIFNEDYYTTDRDYTNGWSAQVQSNARIGYQFNTAVKVKKVVFRESKYPSFEIYGVNRYKIQWSDTGVEGDWHDATGTLTYTPHDDSFKEIPITEALKHCYWGVLVIDPTNPGSLFPSINMLQFYGK